MKYGSKANQSGGVPFYDFIGVGSASEFEINDATGALVVNAILRRVERGTLTRGQAKEALDTLGLTDERFRRTYVGSEQGSP